MENFLTIIFALLSVAGVFVSYFFSVKAKVYAATEDAVNNAEQDDKSAEEKMAFAVEQIYSIIPAVAKPFFSKKLIQEIVQRAFDKIEEYAKKQAKKKASEDK